MFPLWVMIAIAILFGWLVMPKIAAFTGLSKG